MMSAVWLLLVIILGVAAVIDLMTYRIPNAITVVLLLLFATIAVRHMMEVEWLSHLAALLLVSGAGVVLFAFRQMGAGDVKLLSALALWAGLSALPWLLVWVSLCGFAAMLVILFMRQAIFWLQYRHLIEENRAFPKVLQKGKPIPYAVGIAPGAILASFSFPPWLWQL